jgi:hypothetical protein
MTLVGTFDWIDQMKSSLALSLLVSALVSGCGTPTYKTNSPLVVPVEVVSNVRADIKITKLTNECTLDSTFEPTIGIGAEKKVRQLFVGVKGTEAPERLSLQLIYFSPGQSVFACQFANSITMMYGNEYRISVEPPPIDQAKSSLPLCKVGLEVMKPRGRWTPALFEGTCSIAR